MKLKRWWRTLTLTGTGKVTVRRHVPWPVRLAGIGLSVGVGAVGAIWTWNSLFGSVTATQTQQRAEIARLRESFEAVETERKRLEAIVNSASSQIKVEQTAAERLAGQIKSLEEDNARLKSDLAYFESLLPTTGAGGGTGVLIRRFEASIDPATQQLRYRAFLMQGGRQEREFSGTIQLVLTTQVAGRPGTWTWPDQAQAEPKERSRLVFKRYQRLEGAIELPSGSQVRAVQLRVLEKGVMRVQQSAAL